MRTRFKSFLFIAMLGVSALSFGQRNATIIETIVDEGSIRDGSDYTIEITLDRDTFLTTDPAKAALLNGLKGSSTEFDAVVDAIDLADVAFSDADSVVTITINTFSTYYIVDDDSIGITIPALALRSNLSLDSPDSIIILNLLPTVSDGGTANPDASESEIRAGGQTYILTLTDNLWDQNIELSGTLLTDVQNMFSSTLFDPVAGDLALGNLDVSADSKDLTITFNARSDFYISGNEVVNVTVPQSLLAYTEAFATSTASFTINNVNPVITITDSTISEGAIRAGTIPFMITLEGDIWADPLSADFNTRIDGDGTQWDAVVKNDLIVSRISDTEVRVLIPAKSGFDISSSEDVTITVIAADLQNTVGGPYSVTGTKTITPLARSIVASGSLATTPNLNEGDIRTNSYEITVELFEDTWVAGVGSGGVDDDNLLASITSSPSTTAWNNLISSSTVSAPAAGVVTITIPAQSNFNITSDISLSINAPSSLFAGSTSLSDADFATIDSIGPSMVITSDPSPPLSESDLDGALIIVKLYEETFADGSFVKENFTLNMSTATALLRINADGDIDLMAPDSAHITLKYTGSFSTDRTMGLTIDAAELTGSIDLTNLDPDIYITAVIEPVITNVTISNTPMGIDDVVTVTITVAEDDNNGFTYAGGTVAGRTLTNFRSATGPVYLADFTITENSSPEYIASDTIPVTNLQLFNGLTPGNLYSSSIIGTNDPLDSQRPVVDLIDLNSGTYKIGDQIIAIVHAGESGLTFDQALTTVNTVPLSNANVSGTESGSGIYRLSYTVADGDPDVSGSMPVEVVMKDYVGNPSNPFNTVSGTSPVIDANYPEISSVSVTSTGVKIPGQTVVLTIVATESGLSLGSGSHVNFVTNPGQLAFDEPVANTYTLTYTISSDDDGVANSGDLEATIVLVDGFGNATTQVNGLLTNTVTIVTDTPSAYIYGGGQICPGGSVPVTVSLAGQMPFEIIVYDGVGSSQTYSGINSNSFSFNASPGIPDNYSYTVTTVVDGLGVTGTSAGAANVVLNVAPNPTITSDRFSFQENEEGYPLTANPAGGFFSGKGVVTVEDKFYPSIATTVGSPHTVTYTYTDPATGCVGTTQGSYSVVSSVAGITMPDTICYNAPQTTVTGSNTTGVIPGSFQLYKIDELGYLTFIPGGLTDPNLNDNQANIIPTALSGGAYRVYYFYYYLDIYYTYIFKTFILDEVSEIVFTNPPDNVCNDQGAIPLVATPGGSNDNYFFEGQGVTGLAATGFYFNPGLADLGYNTINYEFTSRAGCKRDTSLTVIINDVPEVHFTPQDICIPQGGDSILFLNSTTKDTIISKWEWISGTGENQSIRIYDSFSDHRQYYDNIGPRDISLKVTTDSGCVATFDTTIIVGDIPRAAFRWESDCYLSDVGVNFINDSKGDRALNSFEWIFGHHNGAPITSFELPNNNSVEFLFDEMDKYDITLIATNDLMCSDTVEKVLTLKPTHTLKDSLYFETFNKSDGTWSIYEDDNSDVNSWVYGVPDFKGFVPLESDSAWFTSFDKSIDPDERNERSWIQSLCFDFNSTDRPMIRMDMMRSFDENRDGAVLQYTLDNGVTWTTVGLINEGINWYNSIDINEKPGAGEGSSIGWTADSADVDWINAAHDLDKLKGERSVIFGIFYAGDGKSDNTQGFAVDNIYIGERTKRALIEHFTNSASEDAPSADAAIDNFTAVNALDVTNLQYHMHYPGDDPMNEINSSPGSSRSFYYGITELPFALLDGGTKPSYTYNFSPSVPTVNQVRELTLESPKFEMDVVFQLYGERLSTTIDMKALQDIDSSDIILNVAVVEKSVTAAGANGDTEFKNVVRGMLPSPAGFLYSRSWRENDLISKQYSWSYNGVDDASDLMVVAFLQERKSGKVLQVASEDKSEFGVGTVNRSIESMKVYPNPAQNELYVTLNDQYNDGTLEITDMTGRVVFVKEIYQGEQVVFIDIEKLAQGSYILQSKVKGKLTGRTNFIKVK